MNSKPLSAQSLRLTAKTVEPVSLWRVQRSSGLRTQLAASNSRIVQRGNTALLRFFRHQADNVPEDLLMLFLLPTSSLRIWVLVVLIPSLLPYSDEHLPAEFSLLVLSKSWVSNTSKVSYTAFQVSSTFSSFYRYSPLWPSRYW